VSFNTLAPIATAGIPVDDVLTLSGGRLQRGKLQLEWHSPRAFFSVWVNRRKVLNISFDPLAGSDNGTTELAELSRINPPSLQSLAIELPEGIPRFASSKIREWGLSHERALTENLSLHLRYRHAKSKNPRCPPGKCEARGG